MAHYIVTGGAGFIGSHLTEQLLSEGSHVTVVDNLTTGRKQNLPHHPCLKLLPKAISNCRPEDFSKPVDGIAHLAATPSVSESWLNPLQTHHNNLSATISVIKLCQALKIRRLVFASSAAVYGNPTQLPISESYHANPISPYGLQKLAGEQYASMFAQEYGFSFVGLRLFNVFGSRQVPNSPYSGVISIFVSCLRNNLPITIYGDGTQTRDFIYVKDIAKGFSQALKTSLKPGSSLICNLGTGKSISLIELVNILKTCFPQWQENIIFAVPRLGDIKNSQADISCASSNINFAPQWTPQTGLKLLFV